MAEMMKGSLALWICYFILVQVCTEARNVGNRNSQTSKNADAGREVNKEAKESQLVYPQVYHMSRRRKRSQLDLDEDEDLENPNLNVLVIRRADLTFYIELQPNEDLNNVSVTIHQDSDSSEIMMHTSSCLFHGAILNHPGGMAAISTCAENGRMSGILLTPEGHFLLRPWSPDSDDRLKPESPDGALPHILYQQQEDVHEFCGVDTMHRPPPSWSELPDEDSELLNNRVKRANTQNRKVMEVAVFVDSDLYNRIASTSATNARRATVRRVLGIMSQVQLIYNYASLDTQIKLVVVKLEILQPNASAPNKENGNIDKYLDNFCVWQSQRNLREGSNGHWDHAIMLTGRDLYKDDKGQRNLKVLGLAWVNGMCRSNYSCTLNEGGSFEAAFVIAHEMGHNLGIMHDGSGNNCDRDKYIMSDKTGPGKVSWSSCSNVYLKKFFTNGYGWCLEDDAAPPNRSYDLQRQVLPGARYTLKDQCILALGSGYVPHQDTKEPFNNVCRELWCASGSWAKPAHPALEGSPCATGKACFEGVCKRSNSISNRTENRTGNESSFHRPTRRVPNGDIYNRIEQTIRNVLRNIG